MTAPGVVGGVDDGLLGNVFSHWHWGISPPSLGGRVIEGDVGMGSTQRGWRRRLTASLLGATLLSDLL